MDEGERASTDYGKDHSAVVALQQKHQALEVEIEGGCVVAPTAPPCTCIVRMYSRTSILSPVYTQC